jgi:hypothetical protein
MFKVISDNLLVMIIKSINEVSNEEYEKTGSWDSNTIIAI